MIQNHQLRARMEEGLWRGRKQVSKEVVEEWSKQNVKAVPSNGTKQQDRLFTNILSL